MTHHEGKIWLKTHQIGTALHFKVYDSEFGETESPQITHLIYHPKTNSWSGFLQYEESRFVLSHQMAIALFKHFFNLK